MADTPASLLHRAWAGVLRGELERSRQILDAYRVAWREQPKAERPPLKAYRELHLVLDRLQGRPEEAIASGSGWVREARRASDHGSLAVFLNVMAQSALDLSDLDRARTWFDEAFHHAERAGDGAQCAAALRGNGMVCELRGEHESFRSFVASALHHAKAAGSDSELAESLTAMGRYRIARGDPGGEEQLIEAAALFMKSGHRVAAVKTLFHRLPLAMRDRDAKRARAIIDAARNGLAGTADRQLEGMVYLDGGEVSRLEGDIEAAREQYRASLDCFGATHPLARIARVNLAITAVFADDMAEARAALPRLLEETRGHGMLHGLAHLIALALGPISAADSEDALWTRHGTGARLGLDGYPGDPDVIDLARRAIRRMARHGDSIQAGRAALLIGLVGDAEIGDLVQVLRGRNAAVPIGSFLGIQRLGSGGMGDVWLGRHADRDTPAAMKVVRRNVERGDVAWKVFDNEMRAVAQLNHPNIVGVLDHGRAGAPAAYLSGGSILSDSPYLALEYVRGGTLTRWIGRMKWEVILSVLRDILAALAHAHARGVLHLDLKPDNLLLRGRRPEHGIRLTDFGLALLRGDTRDGIAGTLDFMAPEQYLGEALGPATDLYALGCLAWGLVTGSPPFHGGGQLEMARRHVKGALPPFEPRLEVPRAYEQWCRRLLEKAPSDRYDRASDALEDLLAIVDLPTRPIGVPDAWAAPESESVVVPDAGLALVHDRRPTLAGMRAERDQLWSHLRTCFETRSPVFIALDGPFGSGRQALRSWLGTRSHELGFTAIVQPKGGLAGLLDTPPPAAPAALAEALTMTLTRKSQGRIALVWVDGSDLLLPAAFDALRSHGGGPFLFVVIAPGSHIPADLDRIPLRRLADAHIQQLLLSILPLDPALVERLVRWSAGNPGFAVATLRDLAKRGELRPGANGWWRAYQGPFRVPRQVSDHLKTDLRRIANTAERWEALQVLAAWGNIVNRRAFTALVGTQDALVTQLCEARILEDTGGVYRWRQPAARALLLAEPSVRLAHGRIAEYLGRTGAPPAIVAEQFVAAHRYTDAHRPLLDAIQSAIDNDDAEQAAEFYRSWLEALERLAVGPKDPRRLAGRRYAHLLESSAG